MDRPPRPADVGMRRAPSTPVRPAAWRGRRDGTGASASRLCVRRGGELEAWQIRHCAEGDGGRPERDGRDESQGKRCGFHVILQNEPNGSEILLNRFVQYVKRPEETARAGPVTGASQLVWFTARRLSFEPTWPVDPTSARPGYMWRASQPPPRSLRPSVVDSCLLHSFALWVSLESF